MRAAAFCFLFLTLFAGSAFAEPTPTPDRETAIAEAAGTIAVMSADLRDGGVDDPAEFERRIRDIVEAARRQIEPIEVDLKRAEESLALLGTPPKEGEPPEYPAIASERADANTLIASLRGQRTKALAVVDEGSSLLGELSKRRLRDYYRRILKRGDPLVSPSLWRKSTGEFAGVTAAVEKHFAAWSSKDVAGGRLWATTGLIAALIAAFLMYAPVRKFLRGAVTSKLGQLSPSRRRRVALAGVVTLEALVPAVIGGALVVETARALGLVDSSGVSVVSALWIALISCFVISGFFSGLRFAPATHWALNPEAGRRARQAARLALWLAIVVGAKEVIEAIAVAASASGSLTRLINGLAAVVAGGLLFALCENNLWPRQEANGDKRSSLAPVVRFAGRGLAVLMIAAALAGHVNLADFLATRLVYVAIVAIAILCAQATIKEGIAAADRRMRSSRSGVDRADAFTYWLGAGVDVTLFLLALPALLLLAGVDPAAVRDFLARAFAGFRVGGVFISLADIVLAVGAFVGILALTRIVQGALQRGPLAHSSIDAGVQNSLTTLFGYVGLTAAAVVSLAIIGVNFTNLALIAGALSVGIGFGLQSIVNNFVSGLILLFERPIKAGDWIVTASGEGVVKKISFRSTEIETFDRSSIIVPNSELVASTVTNWTHKSSIGRIRVPVGVSYGSDPERVREILLKCAAEHPQVVAYPEPFVVWMEFGSSSLDFELRAFVNDITRGIQVRTDLRYAIFNAFKAEGVEFPFPQQDVHIRSMPDDRRAAAGSRRSGSPAPSAAPRREPEEFDSPDD